MAVGYSQLPPLYSVAGLCLATTASGIKYPNRPDLTLIEVAEGTTAAGLFTRNAFCAAPVTICRRHLAQKSPRYLLINTGNANAGTGSSGLEAAVTCCDAVAVMTGCDPAEVLPFSTGVIGVDLPVERAIIPALPTLWQGLNEENWAAAAQAIMTTDTVAKGASRQFELNGQPVTLTGIAKGAGMIRPDMATMLAFIATDAAIEEPLLQTLLTEAVRLSFNRVTVDGDTSTNDSCLLLATGAGGAVVTAGSVAATQFQQQLNQLLLQLAQLLVRDGEGATKFITIAVSGAATEAEAEQVAFTIAHSPLVKTALFASDPNWGRILAAIGRAGVVGLDINALTIALNGVSIVRDGGRDPSYTEAAGAAAMAAEEITIAVSLARGGAAATVWSCDFSYDYVKINAEYRS